jgi:hypothetical protein
VATKSTDFRQELGVPVGVAHEVVTSERYLFTLDGSETDPGTMVVSEHEIDRRDDGSVYARAVAGKADPEAETPPMVMEQVSEISVPGDDGAFTMDSTVPLPKSMGTMRTLQRFGPGGRRRDARGDDRDRGGRPSAGRREDRQAARQRVRGIDGADAAPDRGPRR